MLEARRLRGLYAIADTGYLSAARLAAAVDEAIAGGAAAIQYRDKGGSTAARRRQAQELLAMCRAHAVPLIINDDVALARALAADGVHLGRDDPPLAAARAELGGGSIIGVSCYDELERALAGAAQGADYVAFGSFYASPTKPRAARAELGVLRAARARLGISIVAIGGITPENGGALLAAGADALAVIDGVFNRSDVRAAAQRYARLFETPT